MPALRWACIEAVLDPTVGSEQQGRRPVLIVSNDAFNAVMRNVTVLPMTSTRRDLYPSEVLLPMGVAGQPIDSIVMAHQVRTISKDRLGRIFGYLADSALQEAVMDAIREHFDLSSER